MASGWTCTTQGLNSRRGQHFVPRRDGAPVQFREVLRHWQDDDSFRDFFVGLLSAAPFAAYRWETRPVTATNATQPFEFVLLDAPGLTDASNAEAFADQFRAAKHDKQVVAFPNLGKDAVLVIPCPAGPVAAYAHLAAFVRGAPLAQQHELWQHVGAAMETRLGGEPVWLSTAGMGIAWLHIRLDSRPKYYSHEPYRLIG